MQEFLRDPEDMAQVVRRRLLRAMVPAMRKLDRVAKGKERFKNEHEIRACIALARLSPVFIARLDANQEPEWVPPWERPDWTPERELARRQLDYLRSLTLEQKEEHEKRRKAIDEEWTRIQPPAFASPEECDAYYRQPGRPKFSDLEETPWPPQLRKSNFMKEYGNGK